MTTPDYRLIDCAVNKFRSDIEEEQRKSLEKLNDSQDKITLSELAIECCRNYETFLNDIIVKQIGNTIRE